MVKILGHRGCRGKNNPPENSLAAFAEAINQGADGIEFDLFLTRDKQLVVFHDDTLEKLTNGKGETSAKTLAELKKLRLQKSSETIPTLDEVLTLVKKTAPEHFLLNIEVKQKGIAREVAAALRHYIKNGWRAEQFLVASFDMASLRIVQKELPEIPIGALFAGRSPSWNISARALAKKLKANATLKPATVNITLPSVTAATVALIEKSGAKPVAWTVREKKPIKPKKYPPLFALITDYPAEMRACLA
jgi:glycerophosphoryl diester phosphodiesterase